MKFFKEAKVEMFFRAKRYFLEHTKFQSVYTPKRETFIHSKMPVLDPRPQNKFKF